jgi:hypothetical protein
LFLSETIIFSFINLYPFKMFQEILNYIQENLFIILIVIIALYIVYRLFISRKHQHSGKCKITNYYANWCGYSRAFLPVWKEFTVKCQEEYPNVITDEIVCEGNGETICQSENVKGYPTVILENGHRKVIYEDARTVDALLQFVRNNL